MYRAIFFLFFNPLISWAQTNAAVDIYQGKMEMNGHKLSEFANFSEKWSLVTVRYRRDSGEMRFTYANELAWKTLLEGKTEYPDGAIFAKIGRKTEEDPAFTSSAVPSGAKRYQFMVRDKSRYKETSGWGYVLFDAQGKTFPGEPKAAARACAACHSLVPERGYVFSQAMNQAPSALIAAQSRVQFSKLKTKDLPPAIKNELPKKYQEFFRLVGAIGQAIFQGTLDEVMPLLSDKVASDGLPAILYSEDGMSYAIVFKDELNKSCVGNQIAFMSIRVAPQIPDKKINRSFCQSAKP